MSLSAILKELLSVATTIRVEDSLAVASTTLLLYDHCLTFADEVKYIWKKPKTPLSCLYLLNRYFAPSIFIICLIDIPDWPAELCSRFAKFQGVFTAVSVMVAELMLVLRVYAVHHQSKVILAIILSIWSAQLACISYVLAHTLPAPLPRTPITFGCFLISDPAIGNRYILYIAPGMVFDTTIFLMLSTAIFKRAKEHPLTTMLQIILRDGILYFTVVLLLNAAWLTTALTLPTNSQNILAFPCVVMTVTLIGRLTLNLRKGSTSVIFDTSTNGDGRIRRFVHLESGGASTGVGGAGVGVGGEGIELSVALGRGRGWEKSTRRVDEWIE